ncbi:MAG: TetR/AcrR family transcriptional regulator [Candidatus Eisenbacteria bacterium]
MSRRELEREARRQAIIDAARRLFFDKGFEETTMEDIAGEADYTRRTLYEYFRSREEICLLVVLEGLDLRQGIQQEAMRAASIGLEKVRRWGEAFWEFAKRYPAYLHIQAYWDYRGIDRNRIDTEVFQRFETANERIIESLREAFRQGIDDGSIRGEESTDMLISHYAYTLRTVMNKALFPAYSFASFDSEAYVAGFLGLFIRAIGIGRSS